MQVQGTDELIHQRESWGPRHAVSKASLPHPFQPGRPIRSAASHIDGQPRLQLSGARLTSLKKKTPGAWRDRLRSLVVHGRRAGWLHLGAHHAAFREKLPVSTNPSPPPHITSLWDDRKDKPQVAHAPWLSTRAAAHPLDKCRSCCIRSGSAPPPWALVPFSDSVTHILTGSLLMVWMDICR